MKTAGDYNGFESGPIRPPSEAGSLILRVTRNCSWNRCRFCGLYKGEKFSLRPVDDVIKDIDSVKHCVDLIAECQSKTNGKGIAQIAATLATRGQGSMLAFSAALNWIRGGMESVFLQDANSMIVKPGNLVKVLDHIKQTFPGVKRTTSYARSKTVMRIEDEALQRLADAGLNRIHIGIESGSDEVLKMVDKGIDKAGHILAGQKVKRAGIELSVYYMPGLGGERFSHENAQETADAINRIDPDFIRIRSLAIAAGSGLYQDVRAGTFTPLGDRKTAEELLLFIESLEGIHSCVKSDHILNLLPEVEGRLPEEKALMTAPLKRFLTMSEQDQLRFMVGRRTGIFTSLNDTTDPFLSMHAEQAIVANEVTVENVEAFSAAMMTRFI
ncbi:MAG: radical SAM protein [Gammaproteobacteria bacterium]|nr:radical SAM protein [Gammaproteobacteria bacterium]